MRRRPHFTVLFSLVCICAGLIGLIGVAYSDALARAAWRSYRAPKLALALAFRDANLAFEIGNFYFGGSEYRTPVARKAFKRAVAIDPTLPWGNYQLARVYFVENRLDKALRAINRELEIFPNNIRALYVRGLVEGYSGMLAEAEEDFARFLEYAPYDWAPYNDLAWIEAAQGDFAAMRETARAGIERAIGGATNPWLWNMLGVAELNLNNFDAAEPALREARAMALALTSADWRAAYPGNNPDQTHEGLAAFRAAIDENLFRAVLGRSDQTQ